MNSDINKELMILNSRLSELTQKVSNLEETMQKWGEELAADLDNILEKLKESMKGTMPNEDSLIKEIQTLFNTTTETINDWIANFDKRLTKLEAESAKK